MAKTAEQLVCEYGPLLRHLPVMEQAVMRRAMLQLANACFEEAAQVAESQTNHSGRLTGNIVIREIGERIRALESPAPGPAKKGGGK